MRRSEVWRVSLPPAPGHVQAGDRPAVVVQIDAVTAAVLTVLIVPFTTSLATLRFPGTLLIQPDGQNGLTAPSVALVFQFRAIDQNNRVRKLGILDTQTLDQLLDILDRLTGRKP